MEINDVRNIYGNIHSNIIKIQLIKYVLMWLTVRQVDQKQFSFREQLGGSYNFLYILFPKKELISVGPTNIFYQQYEIFNYFSMFSWVLILSPWSMSRFKSCCTCFAFRLRSSSNWIRKSKNEQNAVILLVNLECKIRN